MALAARCRTGCAAVTVAGIFGLMRLLRPAVRARRFRWTLLLAVGPLLATWAVMAIIAATAPGPSTLGFEGALIPAVTIYVFAWSVLKGLLHAMSGVYEDDQDEGLPAARPTAAVAAVLGGHALIPGLGNQPGGRKGDRVTLATHRWHLGLSGAAPSKP